MSPWDELKHGLVLGGENLWEQVCTAVAGKSGEQEAVWSHQVDIPARREQVRMLSEKETDEWVKMWLRVRWGGERKSAVARQLGYAGGSAVVYAMRQLERRAQEDASVREKLQRLAEHFERLKS